jgi:hypothetical protein
MQMTIRLPRFALACLSMAAIVSGCAGGGGTAATGDPEPQRFGAAAAAPAAEVRRLEGIETGARPYERLIARYLRLTDEHAAAVDPAVDVEARVLVDEAEQLAARGSYRLGADLVRDAIALLEDGQDQRRGASD